MPTYEYQCGTCGHRFEKYQSFNDEPLKTCPVCGEAVRKVYSAAGIIFKGSGWYVNDSRKSGGNDRSDKAETGDKTEKSEKSDKVAVGDKAEKSEVKAESASSAPADPVKADKKESKESAA